ncbi:MAG: GNAT family protein [Candidatus Micrarchaeia archaeon]
MPLARDGSRKRKMPQYEIRTISHGFEMKKIGAQEFMDFINPFVDEKAHLAVQEKVTLWQEKAWLEKMADEIDRGEKIAILLFVNGKLAGNCEMRKGDVSNQRHNTKFGLAVSRQWRGHGFGEMLLRRGIAVAKKEFRPHKMWIEHDSENKIAARLYRKVGFAQVARLKHYAMHFGRYTDNCIMEYRGK